MTLPPYFDPPPANAPTFGHLRFREDERGAYWMIEEAEPQAVVTVKRVFPGAQGRGSGFAKFPAGPRQMADLLWFLQRWPMAIAEGDRPRFELLRQRSIDMLEERESFERSPPKPVMPAAFRGTLRSYQEPGAAWLVSQRRTLLGDEMGIGKTIQAIGAAAALGRWPAVIVVPPHLVRQWEQQLDAFLEIGAVTSDMPLFSAAQGAQLRRHTIRGLKSYRLPDAEIYVIHYLLLAAHRKALEARGVVVAIFNEIQELRHAGTAKYSAAHAIAARSEYCWGLSGTPIYNRGGEIWNVTNIVEMHCLGDWDSFTREWCAGYGSDTVEDPARLGVHLRREGLLLRRLKREVLANLPPKNRLVQSVDGDPASFNRLIARAVTLAEREAETEDHLERGRLRREIDAITRHATGMSKATSAAVFIRSLIEAGEAVLVFAWHHDVVDVIQNALAEFGCVAMTGRQSEREKDEGKRRFIDGEVAACILNLRSSAGVDGLQIRNPVVVFAELDWSPAVHAQCEDRANRDGVTADSTFCYYLVSEFGSDPEMQDRLGLKIQQFRGIMGDATDDPADNALAAEAATKHLDRVMERLRALGKAAA